MRKIHYLVHTSVDGHVEGPNGEFDWAALGPELAAYSEDLTERVDTFLYGRAVWELMSSSWPTAESVAGDDHTVKFAPIWRAMPKIILSRTLQTTAWNSRVIGADLGTRLAEPKARPGKDLLLTGGSGAGAVLTELGLIDDYHVIVHPVVLGGGKSLFGRSADRVNLELVQTRGLDSRTVLLHYRPAR